MRVLVHDYAGHPFQVQMSRHLAERGHEVLHAYCGSTHTPQGAMARCPTDPAGFASECLDLGAMIPKTGYLRRLRMESQYGRLLVDACQRFQPEVVLSGNTPSLPQKRLVKHCQRSGIRHVFWVQDIYGLAAYKLLKRKVPLLGHLVGKYFIALDRESARLSDGLVVITKDFIPVFEQWGVDPSRIRVIHNWSVLDELPLRPRDNSWAREHGLTDGPRLLYSGTLAMKHNPELLLSLAKMLDSLGQGQMVVVSEGSGVEWLQNAARESGVKSLHCAGFQPFEAMADVLGSADVLVVILEPDAGVFSVPSKVLSYLCAGRAILGAMPAANLAAQIISETKAGQVVGPEDQTAFCEAAKELIENPQQCSDCGAAARQYAEQNFDIERITDEFEEILSGQQA